MRIQNTLDAINRSNDTKTTGKKMIQEYIYTWCHELLDLFTGIEGCVGFE